MSELDEIECETFWPIDCVCGTRMDYRISAAEYSAALVKWITITLACACGRENVATITFCERCHIPYGVGDWPLCASRANPAGHTRPLEHHPFIPYWDHHISKDGKPVYIDSLAKQWSEMRRNKVDHADEKFARNHKERVERLRDEGRI